MNYDSCKHGPSFTIGFEDWMFTIQFPVPIVEGSSMLPESEFGMLGELILSRNGETKIRPVSLVVSKEDSRPSPSGCPGCNRDYQLALNL